MVSANWRTPRQFFGCNLRLHGENMVGKCDRRGACRGCVWQRGSRAVPLLKKSAAGVFNVLQLQETGADQKRLDVLLVYGYVSVVREIDQRFQSTLKRNEIHRSLYCQPSAHQELTVISVQLKVAWMIPDVTYRPNQMCERGKHSLQCYDTYLGSMPCMTISSCLHSTMSLVNMAWK